MKRSKPRRSHGGGRHRVPLQGGELSWEGGHSGFLSLPSPHHSFLAAQRKTCTCVQLPASSNLFLLVFLLPAGDGAQTLLWGVLGILLRSLTGASPSRAQRPSSSPIYRRCRHLCVSLHRSLPPSYPSLRLSLTLSLPPCQSCCYCAALAHHSTAMEIK